MLDANRTRRDQLVERVTVQDSRHRLVVADRSDPPFFSSGCGEQDTLEVVDRAHLWRSHRDGASGRGRGEEVYVMVVQSWKEHAMVAVEVKGTLGTPEVLSDCDDPGLFDVHRAHGPFNLDVRDEEAHET
jgi:hypothetical protein